MSERSLQKKKRDEDKKAREAKEAKEKRDEQTAGEESPEQDIWNR